MRRGKRWLAVILVALCAARWGDAAADKKQLVRRIDRAKAYFDDLMAAPDTAIPAALLKTCRGIGIMRLYKAGFWFGAKGGLGIVLVRDEQSKVWSAPAFITSAEGSFGFQIGGQAIDTIFLIMNKEGVEMLMKTHFKIGVDASAAAGPVGRDLAASVGPGTAILVYSRAKGLFAGAAIEGGLLVSDDDANHQFYGKPYLSPQEILFGKEVPVPEEAKPLISALEKYTPPAPAGQTATDTGAAPERTTPDTGVAAERTAPDTAPATVQ